MGIGTSQGAFYRDEGHYNASMWDDKYDDNVITDVSDKKDKMPFPDNNDPNTDFNSRFGNLPPSGILNDLKKPSEPAPLVRRINDVVDAPDSSPQTGHQLNYDEANQIYNAVGNHPIGVNSPYNAFHSDVVNKLLGTNGEERYQLWPERMIRDLVTTAGKVNKGEVPMWAIDPSTGEMHTSLDAMQAAWSMMPGANSATLGAAGAVARAGMEARSGIQDVVEGSVRERKAVLSSDRLYVGRGSQEELDSALHGRNPVDEWFAANFANNDWSPTRATEDNYLAGRPRRQSSIERFVADENAERNSLQEIPRYHSPEERDALAREASPPELIRKQGKIALMTNNTGRGAFSGGGDHMYYFKTDGDKIGKVDVSIKKDGKELYIHGIAGVGRDRGAGNFGTRDMIDLIKALRKEHPGTTSIGGYRISGARRKSAQDQGDRSFTGSDAHSNFTSIAEPD